MHTLKDAALTFAKLDGIPERDFPQYDKKLRDLSQRFPLPASGMSGRAATYSTAQICAIRIVQKAFDFQFPRERLTRLARFLDERNSTKTRKAGAGRTPLSVIEHAVEHVKSGEDHITFHLSLLASGEFKPGVDWEYQDVRVASTLAANDANDPWDARLSVPASRLIREVLHLLGELPE